MTGIPASSIAYYRRTDKIITYSQEHKNKVAEAMNKVRESEGKRPTIRNRTD